MTVSLGPVNTNCIVSDRKLIDQFALGDDDPGFVSVQVLPRCYGALAEIKGNIELPFVAFFSLAGHAAEGHNAERHRRDFFDIKQLAVNNDTVPAIFYRSGARIVTQQ